MSPDIFRPHLGMAFACALEPEVVQWRAPISRRVGVDMASFVNDDANPVNMTRGARLPLCMAIGIS